MSEPAAEEAKPPKNKKMLIIILAAVLVLGGGGGGAFFFMSKSKKAAADGEEEVAHAPAPKPGTPPVFFPLETLVVNLADPGGERFAQVGITLEVADAKVADAVKALMPTVRNDVLMKVSQRTTTELLQVEGKQKLAADIRSSVGAALGFEEDEEEEDDPPKKGKKPKKPAGGANPVKRVLFTSFIVQ